MNKITILFNKYREVIMYLVFGVLTTIVSLGIYYLLTYKIMSNSPILDADNPIQLQIANIISWIVSVLFAYVTNRKYVFSSKNSDIFKEMGSFIGSRIITLLMDMLIMFIGVTLLKENDKIIKIISQIIVIVGNYIFSKIFVFKKVIK